MESPATGLLPHCPTPAAADRRAPYSNTPSVLMFHALPERIGHELLIVGTLILFAGFFLFIRQRKRSKVSVTR